MDGVGVDQAPEVELARPISEIKAELFRALAHPARIRILEVLAASELSVGEIQPRVGIEMSHLSQQLAVLRRAGLVNTRKSGSSVFYAIRDPELVRLLASAKQLLINSLTVSQQLLTDLSVETSPA
jgi:DNA-binding transcriptional ArsR family regulator